MQTQLCKHSIIDNKIEGKILKHKYLNIKKHESHLKGNPIIVSLTDKYTKEIGNSTQKKALIGKLVLKNIYIKVTIGTSQCH